MNGEMSDRDWINANSIILSIYKMRPYPELSAVTDRLKELVSFTKALTCMISDVDGSVKFFDFQGMDIPEKFINSYISHYVHFDFIQWLSATPKAITVRESDVITDKYMEESVFMREWMEPLDIYHSLLVNISANGHSYGNITLYRPRGEGSFSDRDIRTVELINEHLCGRFGELFPNGIFYDSLKKSGYDYMSVYGLTKRENEVVTLIAQGTPRKELAKSLFISENTLKNHLNSIYAKMKVSRFDQLLSLLHPIVKW